MPSKLKLVGGKPPSTPEPPRSLGKTGRRLWDSIHAEYAIVDAGGVELLLLACEALERAEQLREQIDKDGPVIRLKGGVLRDHPALKHELANRAFVTRAIARLGLDVEPLRDGPGRPTMGGFNGN